MIKLLQLVLLVLLGVGVSRMLRRTRDAVRQARGSNGPGPEPAEFEVLDDEDDRS